MVIAPDKFKGSLDSAGVAAALADGLRAGGLTGEIVQLGLADGGEGTVDAALRVGYRRLAAVVAGPLGNPVEAAIAVDPGSVTAVVELAAASGLGALPEVGGAVRRDALAATSRGTGELIAAALDAGCAKIILGVGGSACTDGGAGLLTALGARLLDADGRPIPDGGGGLGRLASADLSGLDPRLGQTELVLAADVANPLLGSSGAAAMFGPQKGASPSAVAALEANLKALVEVLAAAIGDAARTAAAAPGSGAAGGVGFAALLLGAVRRPGIEVVMELVELDAALAGADAVITGEGSLDRQSLAGKTPLGVARRARALGAPLVLAVCGRAGLSGDELRAAGFDRGWALTDLEPDIDRCLAEADPLLRRLGARIAAYLRGVPGR